MITFAIELSTIRASIAICEEDRVIAEASWTESRARHQQVFDEVPGLLTRAGLDWRRIDQFAVGRGPGAFSGIRIGLMAAQMFAAPLAQKVIAVSSGEAIADEMRRRGDVETRKIVVCGDARRGMFWFGVFGEEFSGWKLCRAEEFASVIPSDAIIATPHWQQVGPLRAASKHCWIEGDQFPTAHAIARIALAKGSGEPLEPIYLHPPV